MPLDQQVFSDFGGAASDLFAGFGDQAKASGDFAEAGEYSLASQLATQNEKFTETSTAIKEAQQSREMTEATGGLEANIAGSGFSDSGSSLDLLRDSASQGALAHAALGQQGLITEAGYTEQAKSYSDMATAATNAGNAANDASTFSDITSVIKAVAGMAELGTPAKA